MRLGAVWLSLHPLELIPIRQMLGRDNTGEELSKSQKMQVYFGVEKPGYSHNGDVDFSNTVPLRVGRQACFGALGLGMKKLLGAGDNRKNHAAKAFYRCLSECGLDTEKLETIDHHLCHAVSGFSTSDFNNRYPHTSPLFSIT